MAPPNDPERATLKRQKQEERKRINRLLDPHWKRGMRSAKSDLVATAITSTGISGRDVKSYIDRKKRKVKYASLKSRGQLPKRPKKLRLKKVRGYDKFRSFRMQQPDMKSLSGDEQGKKMRIVTAEWMGMPKVEQQKWNDLAKKDNENFKSTSQNGKRLLKKVKDMCKELWELGIVATLLLPPEKGVKTAISVHHPPEMKPFWNAQMMDPVLMGFGEQIKRCEALYLMRLEAGTDPTQESPVTQEQNHIDTVESTEIASLPTTIEIPLIHEVAASPNPIEQTSAQGTPVQSMILGPIVDVQDVVTVSVVHPASNQNSMDCDRGTEVTLEDALQNVLGEHTGNNKYEDVTNEVVDMECKSATDALNSAKALAKKIEKKAAWTAEQKENKRVRRKGKLIGKKIRHLWAMTDDEKSWFDGVIVRRDGEQYMIRYEDDEGLIPLAVTEFQKFRRNKTLIVE